MEGNVYSKNVKLEELRKAVKEYRAKEVKNEEKKEYLKDILQSEENRYKAIYLMKEKDINGDDKLQKDVNQIKIEIDEKIGNYGIENQSLEKKLKELEIRNKELKNRSRLLVSQKFDMENEEVSQLIDSIDNITLDGINSEIESISIDI